MTGSGGAQSEQGGVLIVEDDTEAAEELVELLSSYGLRCAAAATPAAARSLAAAMRPHLALIDLELGTESGVPLAAEWHRQNSRGCPGSPRLVLLSGRKLTSSEAAQFGSAPPPLWYKPLNVAALLAYPGLRACSDPA